MRRVADYGIVLAAGLASAAAVSGGAFFGAPRVVVGACLAVLVAWMAATWRGRLVGEEWLLLAAILWGVGVAMAKHASPLAAKETLTIWLSCWCLWLLARRTGGTARDAGAVVLTCAAALVSAGVVAESLGLGGPRVGGLLENPNVAASLLAPAVPLAFLAGRGRRHPLSIVVAGWIGCGLLLTGSRAGLLAALAAVVLMLPRGRLRLAASAGGAAAVAAVLVWRFQAQPDVLAWHRTGIWAAVLKLWLGQPLTGVGAGGLSDAAGPVRIEHADLIGHHQFLISYAESTPLAILVQLGAIGMVIVALACFGWVRRGLAAGLLRRRRARAAVAAMAVIAAFHDLLTVDVVLWWWALQLGLLEPEGQRRPSSPGPCAGATCRLAVAVVLSWTVLWGMAQPAYARHVWHRSQRSVEVMERCIRLEPWFDGPVLWRLRDLQGLGSWSWETAAEAMHWSRRAVWTHPGRAGSWTAAGGVHARVVADLGPLPENIEAARAAYLRACELEPHLPWPWLELAQLERSLGQVDRARSHVQRALTEEPMTVRGWLFLARIELDSGRVEAARGALDRAEVLRDHSRHRRLNDYERDLLLATPWQLRQLREALE